MDASGLVSSVSHSKELPETIISIFVFTLPVVQHTVLSCPVIDPIFVAPFFSSLCCLAEFHQQRDCSHFELRSKDIFRFHLDVLQTVEIVMILLEVDVLLAALTNATSPEEMIVVTVNF